VRCLKIAQEELAAGRPAAAARSLAVVLGSKDRGATSGP
jgi:hypothetical protein